jgi:flagellar hook-associated protein 1 FlgK
MSSFFGLNIAVSALRAQQYAIDVTAHNIANAATPGFHRQEAVFVPGDPLTGSFAMTGLGIPQLGTGVLVQTVRRMQSDYADQQVWMSNQWLGTWSFKNDSLRQVESVISEPGDLGLSTLMDQFWGSWEELSASPESLPARISVVESGVALADRTRTLYRDLRELQTSTDQGIVDNAAQINQLAHEIANINEQVRRSNADGYQPNDLMDRRGLLLDQLSQIARVQVNGASGSELIVSISGKALIQGDHVTEVSVTQGANGWSQLVWADDGSAVQVAGGELAGQLEIRDNVVEGYIQSLNTIAQTIVTRVNALHSTGVTTGGAPAGNFFVPGTDASNIAVESSLVAAPDGVATSTTGNPGDNSLALAIASVKDEVLIDGETIGGAYSGLVALIGSNARQAASRTDAHTLSGQQLATQRESIGGVSLDEEMANMVKFQQAYNAAARVFTVIDEMIGTVITGMGVGGR